MSRQRRLDRKAKLFPVFFMLGQGIGIMTVQGADGRLPNYVELMRRLIADGADPRSVARAEIRHDDWCAVHKLGVFNCNPEILPRLEPERN